MMLLEVFLAGEVFLYSPYERATYCDGLPTAANSENIFRVSGRHSKQFVPGSRAAVYLASEFTLMPRKRLKIFDPETFLATVGRGKTAQSIGKKKIIFSQGDAADAAFYIQEGKIKLTVISHQGKEAVVAIDTGAGGFFWRGLSGQPDYSLGDRDSFGRLHDCAYRENRHDSSPS